MDPTPNPLQPLVESLALSDPKAAARLVETVPEEHAVAALRELSASALAPVFPYLQTSYAASLLAGITAVSETDVADSWIEAVLGEIDPERAAKLFTNLPEDVRERVGAHLPAEVRRQVQELLAYPSDSVGAMMSTNFVAFYEGNRVMEVITKLRALAKKRVIHSYAYVVDGSERLLGVLNMYELLVADPAAVVSTVMASDDVFRIDPFLERSKAADEMARRRYFAAPVVDGEGRLIGVVRAESLIGDAKQEIAADIQKMVGAGAEERAFSPMKASLRQRLPWLHVNLVTAFMAAAVVALFEDVIAKMTVLAVFLPIVAGQGGNAGAQSLAIVMRGLVMREIPKDRVRFLVWKEARLGAISGAVTGLVTGLLAWWWQSNPALGIVIGLGMLVNLFAAGLAGASIPLLMKRLGWDPAQCANIILTTVTDVVGFFAFLGFAVVFQHWLM